MYGPNKHGAPSSPRLLKDSSLNRAHFEPQCKFGGGYSIRIEFRLTLYYDYIRVVENHGYSGLAPQPEILFPKT